ncbi:MAG: tetratricopeptide repeat protein [Planctomycetaceae bacterium]|nr:tetratricopeptide repeat protein [Planctomycetaceae bacterium]
MAMDPYDPCPCGSGKKLKFCCTNLVDEMDQVSRLQQSGQIDACSKKLAELHEKHSGNLWVATSRASVLIGLNEPSQAKDELRELLKNNPDHPQALMLYAMAAYNTDGFEKSRSAIHRCFQKCISIVPDMVGYLAVSVALEMASKQKLMAARQHLVFALKSVSEEKRQEVFVKLHELDSDLQIPYQLRSVHELIEVEVDEGEQKTLDKAKRLIDIGCYGPAAKKYRELSEKYSDNAGMFQNLGLCLAWDGDHVGAAEALHQAGRLGDDSFSAVECETVAQLLDLQETEDRVEVGSTKLELTSVSQALGKLTDQPLFVKVPLSEEDKQSQGAPTEFFQILDRSPDDITLTADSDLEEVPRIVGHVAFYDRSEPEELPNRAYVTGFPSTQLKESFDILRDLLGDTLVSEAPDTESGFEESVAAEEFALFWRWHNPPDTPVVVRRQLEQRQWDHLVNEVWPSTKQQGLGDKTPQEAATAGDQQIPLLASAYVFDAYCSRNQFVLDFTSLCGSLKLDVPETISVDEETPIAHFTSLQLKRIDVKSLADDQLIYVTNRAMMLHHGAFLYEVLQEILERPECGKRVDLSQVYLALVDLSVQKYDRELAFSWLEKGLEWSKDQQNSFELELQWKMRALTLRVEDPQDPELIPVFEELWDKYGKKLPELRHHLSMLAEAYDLPVKEKVGIVTPDQIAGESGGLFTGEESTEADGEKKLWLPGQE